MARPTQIERTPMAQAIRLFRSALGDTQREFAKRTGLTLTSIGRYETNSRPSAEILSRFAKIAAAANLAIFVEVFETRLAPEDAELDMVEISAALHEAYGVLDASGFDRTDMQRLRLTLWIWSAPIYKLDKIESSFKAEFSAKVEELITRTAGTILRGRDLEVENKRIKFFRYRTAENAVEFILAFERHRKKLRDAGDQSPGDVAPMSLKWLDNQRDKSGAIKNRLRELFAEAEEEIEALYPK